MQEEGKEKKRQGEKYRRKKHYWKIRKKNKFETKTFIVVRDKIETKFLLVGARAAPRI